MDVESLIKQVDGGSRGLYAGAVVEGLLIFDDQIVIRPELELLREPHRLVPYLAQMSHESAGFTTVREIWGPTAQQLKYDPSSHSSLSVELGNNLPGDGFRYRGRSPVMVTGKANYGKFTKFCQGIIPKAPNFVEEPEALELSPWSGLAAVWFWNRGNQTGKSLNAYADDGNFEAITRKINGGLTGYEDRCQRYVKYALAALGFESSTPEPIRQFQKATGFTGKDVDGIAGTKTRAAMHVELKKLPATPLTQTSTEVQMSGPRGDAGGYFKVHGVTESGQEWYVEPGSLIFMAEVGKEVVPISIPREALESALEEWGKRRSI